MWYVKAANLMYSSTSSDDEDEGEQEEEDEPEVLVVEQYVQRVLVSGAGWAIRHSIDLVELFSGYFVLGNHG